MRTTPLVRTTATTALDGARSPAGSSLTTTVLYITIHNIKYTFFSASAHQLFGMLADKFLGQPSCATSLTGSCPRRPTAAGRPGSIVAMSTQSPSASQCVEFIRPHLRQLAAYTPIEPFEVLSAKLGRQPEDIVKLDANENPYGPPPEVLEALGSMSFPNIYPDPESRRLRKALAEWQGVPMEHLLVSFAFSRGETLRLDVDAAPAGCPLCSHPR